MAQNGSGPSELLAQVCILTARTPDAKAAVQAITDLLTDHLGSWVFEVWLHRAEDSLDLMARSVSDSIPPERRERLTSSPARALLEDDLPISLVARSGEGRTGAVDDPDLDPTSRDNLVALEVGEISTIPIRDNGTALGIAVVTPPPERSVTEEDEEVLSLVLGNMALLLHRIHQLEADQAQAEQLYRLEPAIQSLPVVVKILSPDGVVEYVNPAVREVLGYSPDELKGQHISLVHEADGAESRQAEVAAAVQGGPWLGDLRYRHRDGHGVTVRLIVAPLRSAESLKLSDPSYWRDSCSCRAI